MCAERAIFSVSHGKPWFQLNQPSPEKHSPAYLPKRTEGAGRAGYCFFGVGLGKVHCEVQCCLVWVCCERTVRSFGCAVVSYQVPSTGLVWGVLTLAGCLHSISDRLPCGLTISNASTRCKLVVGTVHVCSVCVMTATSTAGRQACSIQLCAHTVGPFPLALYSFRCAAYHSIDRSICVAQCPD